MFLTLLFNIFFVVVINLAYTHFKAGKDIVGTLAHLTKKTGAGGRAGVTSGEPDLVMLLSGILYADDAGVIQRTSSSGR